MRGLVQEILDFKKICVRCSHCTKILFLQYICTYEHTHTHTHRRARTYRHALSLKSLGSYVRSKLHCVQFNEIMILNALHCYECKKISQEKKKTKKLFY